MCGISGVFALRGHELTSHPEELAKAMADRLIHRGPDSSGTWANGRLDVGFGHRRLAIVDLSSAGHQPMTSADGRWTITYNGELYNTAAVRSALGLTLAELHGHSDTEVLVEAIARWGVDRTLDTVIGMFAFAAFDRDRDELWLARDRFGEKPLYHTAIPSMFAFGSELTALRAVPGVPAEIDRCSVVELLERSVIPAPYTIFAGVRKLMPGSRLRVRRDGSIDEYRYYDPTHVALQTPVVDRTDDEAVEELEALLAEVVRERTIADVPLGAFLSGGVDSSLVVAMMQQGGAAASTYTIGFEDPSLNEAPAARLIADALGTDHHEWIATGTDALAVVPDLATIYDEPFADSSQIPTTLVSRFARRDLTVALTGDGGDELFGGYERYRLFAQAARTQRIPRFARRAGGAALLLFSEDWLDRTGAGPVGRLLPRPLRRRTGKRVHTSGAILRADDRLALYDLLMRVHRDGPHLAPGGSRRSLVSTRSLFDALQPVELGMAADTVDYMPNDILVKVDRAAMSTSLETRAPLLDHRLHAFAWSLRNDQRVRDGSGKWIMREAARSRFPAIADLPKRGFAVPLDNWLRGPLKQWADDLLAPGAVAENGVLNPPAVQALWHRHQSGEADLGADLWPVLMLLSWSARPA